MAALRAAILFLVFAYATASVLKAKVIQNYIFINLTLTLKTLILLTKFKFVLNFKPNILTNLMRERHPRSIDVSAAHSLINEPKLKVDLSPKSYKLELEPLMENNTFRGRVIINVEWETESKEISLHTHQDLKILQVEVRTKDPM